MQAGKFYSPTCITDTQDELLFARLSANNPEFNLRRDATLILRRKDTTDTVFAAVIEPHGSYRSVSELSLNSRSSIAALKVADDSEAYKAIALKDLKGQTSIFVTTNADASPSTRPQLKTGDVVHQWQGPYHFAE